MQTGRDYSWSKPFTEHTAPDEEYGSHVGQYSVLNIRNRQADSHYAYAHRGDPGSFRSMQMMGFRPVQKGEPEAAEDEYSQFGASSDSLAGTGPFVLMKMPLDKYRKLLADTENAQKASREGPTSRYLAEGEAFNRSYNRRPAGVGAAFAYPEHGRSGYRDGDDGEL